MKEIVDNYEQRGIPLDVLVTDMDWHITFYKEAREGKKDLAGQSIGWTGFTWDNHLFPEPKMFLDWYVPIYSFGAHCLGEREYTKQMF